MGWAATRSNAVKSVVVVVALMMVLSVTGSGGYVFLQSGSGYTFNVAVPFQGIHHQHKEKGEEEADTHWNCSDMLGMEALGESFAPEFMPPSDGGVITPKSVHIGNSPYLPGIFRPPIS